MKKIYFLVLLACFYIKVSHAQNFGFASVQDFPGLGRDDVSSFVIDGKAYVGLGYLSGFVLGSDFFYFDADDNTWYTVAQFPSSARMYATSFSLNGYGYIMGGIGANNVVYSDVWRYDPNNNSWLQQANFPGVKQRGMCTAVWNNNAYAFFGKDTTNLWDDVWKFNGSTWTQLSNFPSIPRYQSASVQLDSIVYFVSGYDASILTDEVWQFNLQTETWTQLADFPGGARWYARGFHYDNKIYIGTGWNTGFLNDFWSYDPATQIWEQVASLPGEERKGGVAFNIGNRAFIGLGAQISGERDQKVWEYVHNVGVEENQTDLVQIFPNPSTGFIQVHVPKLTDNQQYSIVDISGKMVQTGYINSPQTSIEISFLSNGFYYLSLASKDMYYVKKFCVQRQ